MSRTLKRPMFRRGGSTNDGIMSGLTDREQLANGTTGLDVDRARLESKAIQDIFNELSPIPKTRLPLGAVGASLVSGAPIKDALTVGYADFIKRDDARRAAARKREQAAVSTALGSQLSRKGQSKIAVEKMIDLSIQAGEFPDTPAGRNAAFKKYSRSAGDITRASTEQKIMDRFKTFYAGTGGTEGEAIYDVLKDEGLIKIEGTDFGKKDLTIKADVEDITDNENFGNGDGFVDINKGLLYVLKPGGNKDDFTSNSYEITDLKSLY
tara:strand:- start:169 stop:969 length:801 start_codon:yes stop_codon:yes gene_type:complete